MCLYAIDLFSGAGGCSEGLIQAGFHILFSSDISEMAAKTYMHRHAQLGLIQGYNTWFECEDIRKLTGNQIRKRIAGLSTMKENPFPEIDLMMGGSSCQGFSRAGRRDRKDPRNMLFGEYVRIIQEIRPKYIVLENVEGFMDMQFMGYRGIKGKLYPDGSVTPDILRSELNACGYQTLEPRILNAADYGVPQRRHRVIFIGYRRGLMPPSYPDLTCDEAHHITVQEAIGDLASRSEMKSPVSDRMTQFQMERRRGRTPTVDGRPIEAVRLTNLDLPQATDVVRELFSLFQQGETGMMLRKRVLTEGIDIRGKKGLIALCSERFGLMPEQVIDLFLTARASEEQVDVLLTKKNVRKRFSADQEAATIVTLPDDYISPWESRTFSVRELARLQSFDDSFEFLGKRTTGGLLRRKEIPQCTQVGNAVPPLLTKAVALEIKKVILQQEEALPAFQMNERVE